MTDSCWKCVLANDGISLKFISEHNELSSFETDSIPAPVALELLGTEGLELMRCIKVSFSSADLIAQISTAKNIFEAVKDNNPYYIRLFVASGGSLLSVDGNGRTALHHAVLHCEK